MSFNNSKPNEVSFAFIEGNLNKVASCWGDVPFRDLYFDRDIFYIPKCDQPANLIIPTDTDR